MLIGCIIFAVICVMLHAWTLHDFHHNNKDNKHDER
jgi:hypothetical protein